MASTSAALRAVAVAADAVVDDDAMAGFVPTFLSKDRIWLVWIHGSISAQKRFVAQGQAHTATMASAMRSKSRRGLQWVASGSGSLGPGEYEDRYVKKGGQKWNCAFDLTRMLFPSSAASGPLDRDAQGVLSLALGMLLTHSSNTQHHSLFLLYTKHRATPRFQKQQPVPVGPGSYEATGIYSNDSIRQTSLHKVCVHPAQPAQQQKRPATPPPHTLPNASHGMAARQGLDPTLHARSWGSLGAVEPP